MMHIFRGFELSISQDLLSFPIILTVYRSIPLVSLGGMIVIMSEFEVADTTFTSTGAKRVQ